MFLIDLEFDFIQDVLDTLLKDKTTGKNIIWATKNYEHFGSEYSFNSELTVSSVLGLNNQELQPRVHKSKEYQKGRTKERAEVFTPSWVCKDMNDFCDAEWFGIEKDKLDYKYDKNHTFKKYIGLRKLEITCGEAPFIVSRYDAATGKSLSINDRIGFLDRKLQVINENIDDSLEWLEFVKMAYNSSYGYEYQGDNLLKARLNLLITFVEYYGYKFKAIPNKKDLKTISEIISKNIWQMDGLKYTVPNSDIYCKVFKGKTECYYKDLEGEKKMKFDFVVGNPPYQESDGGAQASAIPLYNKFIDESKKISDKMLLIIPARWMTGGKGLDKFRDEMIHDKSIKVLYDFANSKDVFSGVDIKGGVCYLFRDKKYAGKCHCYRKTSDGVSESYRYLCEENDDIFIRENILITIKEKVVNKSNKFVADIVSPRKPYGLSGDTMKNAGKYGLPEFSDEPYIDGYAIYGLDNGQKRIWKYIPKDYPLPKRDGLDKYKVFISEAYGCGNIGEVPSTPVLGTPDQLCTETFLQIGPFETKEESENLLKYIKTKFFRTLVSIKKQTQHTTQKVYKYVPMQDFTENSDIDWSKSIKEIDQQLYKKYGLDEKEIAFIEEKVKEME